MFILGCCSEPLPDCGTVIAKDHRRRWLQLIPHRVGSTQTFMHIWHPERWTITLEGQTAEGKPMRWSRNFSRDVWTRAQIGTVICREVKN